MDKPYIMQVVINILITSGIIALVALGFAIIYQTTRFFHFAHGIVFTSGAYLALFFKTWLGLSLYLSILFTIPLCIILGCLMETSVYLPLRKRGASSLILLLASLGIYIVLQNVISMIFGDDTKIIRSGPVREGLNMLGAKVTPTQIIILGVSVALIIIVTIFLKKTKNGRAMRAVVNDPLLARVSGIDSDRVILWTFGLGSALAGVAGILVSLDLDMTPTMGMSALMMAVVAVIIGGVGSVAGVALGALLIGTVQNLGIWYINSKWQDAIVFVILLAFLLFRPEGFLGKKVSKTAV